MTHHLGQPTYSLSIRASAVSSLAGTRTASAAQVAALDVDLTDRSWGPHAPLLRSLGSTPGLILPAVWIPRAYRGWLTTRRTHQLVAILSDLTKHSGLKTVIFDRPGRRRGQLVDAVRRELDGQVRFATAVRPSQLTAGREHLSEMTALRRVAEEWDVDLALDLLGDIEPGWEAEAAVSRLLPRLTIVRLGDLGPQPSRSGRERLTGRVVAMLVDQGYSGQIALAPSTRPWPLQGFTARALRAAEMQTATSAKFRAMRVDLAHDVSRQS